MPAKAPCAEVTEAVETQVKVVRVAKLMSELATVAKAPARPKPDDEKRAKPDDDKFDEAAWMNASAKPEWQTQALNVVRGALRNISEQKKAQARPRQDPAMASECLQAGSTKKAAEEPRAPGTGYPRKPCESAGRVVRQGGAVEKSGNEKADKA